MYGIRYVTLEKTDNKHNIIHTAPNIISCCTSSVPFVKSSSTLYFNDMFWVYFYRKCLEIILMCADVISAVAKIACILKPDPIFFSDKEYG